MKKVMLVAFICCFLLILGCTVEEKEPLTPEEDENITEPAPVIEEENETEEVEEESPPEEEPIEITECIILANHLESNLDEDKFVGKGKYDLEVGGILMNSSLLTRMDYPYPGVYEQNNLTYENETPYYSLSPNSNVVFKLEILAINEIKTIYLVRNIDVFLDVDLGGFYKFNLKDIELNEENMSYIDNITYVVGCAGDENYRRYRYEKTEGQEFFPCNDDSDCELRFNQKGTADAFHKDDPAGLEWEMTDNVPDKYHPDYDTDYLYGRCSATSCILEEDCSRCDSFSESYSGCDRESDWKCEFYHECECNPVKEGLLWGCSEKEVMFAPKYHYSERTIEDDSSQEIIKYDIEFDEDSRGTLMFENQYVCKKLVDGREFFQDELGQVTCYSDMDCPGEGGWILTKGLKDGKEGLSIYKCTEQAKDDFYCEVMSSAPDMCYSDSDCEELHLKWPDQYGDKCDKSTVPYTCI